MARSRSKSRSSRKEKKEQSIPSIPIKCPVCKRVSFYTIEELSSETIKCKHCGAELTLKPKDPFLELQSELTNALKELLRKIENML